MVDQFETGDLDDPMPSAGRARWFRCRSRSRACSLPPDARRGSDSPGAALLTIAFSRRNVTPRPRRGRDDKIGAPALFAIRHLSAQDFGEARLRSSPAGASPVRAAGAAAPTRPARNRTRVDAAALEQERDVEHDERRAAGAGRRDKPHFGGAAPSDEGSLRAAAAPAGRRTPAGPGAGDRSRRLRRAPRETPPRPGRPLSPPGPSSR